MKKIILALLLLISVTYIFLAVSRDKVDTDEPDGSVPEAATSTSPETAQKRLPAKHSTPQGLSTNDKTKIDTQVLDSEQEQVLARYQDTLTKHKNIEKKLQLLRESQNDSDKDKLYQEIFETTNAAEANNQITNLEALSIKLTTAQNRFDPETYEIEAQKIREGYSHESKQQWKDYLENRDEEFLNYKDAQTKLLKRVNNMTEYPDGLTRNEYLKQEIEKIKHDIYP